MSTRGSKRSREVPPEENPPVQGVSKQKKKKKKRNAGSPGNVDIQAVDERGEDRPSGFPFIEAEVEWDYERIGLLTKPHKLIPAGYESMAGDVNAILRSLPISKSESVRRSAMGEYTRLDGFTTRCCNMLHYVVCHQVTPKPNFDPTSLFFKFDDKVVRFSRVEYALVSGLKFGPATFNPYMKHDLPEDSMFERLFGAKETTTLADVRLAYVNRDFKVNNTKVVATQDDYVRLSKFLLALGFALGFDATKKKIPLWLWVLIEDDKEWEEFPWGSLSFQIMMSVVNGVKKKCPGKKMNYTLKGNTIAFSAWIFEALPALGKAVGLKQPEPQMPRFLQYLYVSVKKGKYPSDEVIKESFEIMLEPSNEEREQLYWQSLESEPSEESFAFHYDAAHSKKKQQNDDDDDEEEAEHADDAPSLTPAQLELVADAGAKKVLEELKNLLDKYHKKLEESHEKLVDDVAERVATKLLEKTNHDMDQNDVCHNNWASIDQIVQAYADDDKGESPVNGEDDACEVPSAQDGTPPLVPRSAKEPDAAPSPPTTTEFITPATFGTGLQKAGGLSMDAATAKETTLAATTDGQAAKDDEIFTDTQIDREFDKISSTAIVVRPVESVPENVRPIRMIIPSKVCRSPFQNSDKRPGAHRFDRFLKGPDVLRNVGLPEFVGKSFFEKILKRENKLLDEQLDAYLAILATRPAFAGMGPVKKRVGVTCCGFMTELEDVFDDIHSPSKAKIHPYEYDDFDPSVAEIVPDDVMAKIVEFANGTRPEWGLGVKNWNNYDKVLAICFFDGNWATVKIKLKEQQLKIYDPKAWNFRDVDHHKNRTNFFIPMARLVPQIVKAIGYFEKQKIRNPQYGQWEITFGEPRGRKAYREMNEGDSALYCLKYLEKFLSSQSRERGMDNADLIAKYRDHVARSIYGHSTSATTIPVKM